jgi:hypothetical protein
MTAEEFCEAMYELGWGTVYLAELLGCREKSIVRYRSGHYAIPAPIATWMRERVALHRAHPPPRKPPPGVYVERAGCPP